MEDVVPWSQAIEDALGDPRAWERRYPRHGSCEPRVCGCEDCASRYPESARARRELAADLHGMEQLVILYDER